MSTLPIVLHCDECGERIESFEHGRVEWKSRPTPRGRSPKGDHLRIVHAYGYGPHPGCYYEAELGRLSPGETVGDVSLPEVLGGDGLMWVLGKLIDEALPRDELFELLKRTRVENYEEARHLLTGALAAGVIENDVAPGCWPTSDLARVIEWARTNS